MYDYNTVKMLHNHGNGDFAPMVEGNDHTSASHDPERAWLAGAKIFRCTRCDEEVVVNPANEDAPGEEPGQGT